MEAKNLMENYTVDLANKWEYENGFYLTCSNRRIGKLLAHWEIYKRIIDLPGDIFEFGVYKGASLVRLLTFRSLLENEYSRRVIGFDAFGKFPNDLHLESDRNFVAQFEGEGGYGIDQEELEALLHDKGLRNFALIQGDIMEKLPYYLEQNPHTKISLLHIDVDVYEPTKLILELCWDRLVTGGVLLLDDYGVVDGETKAVDEWIKDKYITIQKLNYTHAPSFIIKH